MGTHSSALLPPQRGGKKRGQDPPQPALGGLTAHRGRRGHSLECDTGIQQPSSAGCCRIPAPRATQELPLSSRALLSPGNSV